MHDGAAGVPYDQVISSLRITPSDGTAAFLGSETGAKFSCPNRGSFVADLHPSIDAIVTVHATATGTFSDPDHATGTQQATVVRWHPVRRRWPPPVQLHRRFHDPRRTASVGASDAAAATRFEHSQRWWLPPRELCDAGVRHAVSNLDMHARRSVNAACSAAPGYPSGSVRVGGAVRLTAARVDPLHCAADSRT